MCNRFMHPVLSTAFRRQMTSILRPTRSFTMNRSTGLLGIIGVRNNASSEASSASEAGSAAASRKPEPHDPNIRDPAKEVSVETSLRYMKSTGYKETYGDNRVWVLYRRNFKGQFAPPKTRKSCFYKGKLVSGNPCPICRDEFLVLDYRNVDLLKQFISPFNGEILGTEKTGLCQEKHFHLLAEIERAKDYGTISFDVRFRVFNYEEYYPKAKLDKLKEHNHCNHSQ